MEEPPKLPPITRERPATPIEYPPNRRLERMRFLSRLLDTAIPLPGGFRVGIDPIIGLIPGIGDVVASGLSIWLVYDAARLGLRKRVLARMILNVMIEAAIGAVPLIGDFIDAVWKANARNMRLVELHYAPTLKERSLWKMVAVMVGSIVLVYGSLFLAFYLLVSWILAVFGNIFENLFF